MKKIVVIGSGYVGTTSAAIFANCGYSVTAIDLDKNKVDTIMTGEAPFYEHGLHALISRAVSEDKLRASTSYDAVREADIVMSCVGTPDHPDGSSNLSYVFDVADKVSLLMKPGTIFVQKSTVPVGTGQKIKQLFARATLDVSYVSNPEFLREGTAISDFLWFDRVVVGSDDREAAEIVTQLYRTLETCLDRIAALAKVQPPAAHVSQYFITNLNSAELIKVTANAFLALKISFANSISKIADATGADIVEVMDVVGADPRIGRAFLDAGRGYGGGCFPKDVRGLISSASEYGVDLSIMTAASDLNETMPGYIASKLQKQIGEFDGKTIAVLGLAFKAGTSDARLSPGVKLANILAHDGAMLRVYDPEASEEAEADLRKGIEICDSAALAVKSADAVCITTDWPELTELNLADLAATMKGAILVDAVNRYDKHTVTGAGLIYIGVGR